MHWFQKCTELRSNYSRSQLNICVSFLNGCPNHPSRCRAFMLTSNNVRSFRNLQTHIRPSECCTHNWDRLKSWHCVIPVSSFVVNISLCCIVKRTWSNCRQMDRIQYCKRRCTVWEETGAINMSISWLSFCDVFIRVCRMELTLYLSFRMLVHLRSLISFIPFNKTVRNPRFWY